MKPCQNMYLKGKAFIRTLFPGLTASSGDWGPGVLQTDVYMITDGGVLSVDLVMVQEAARSSVFPVSLHRGVGKTNGA